MFWFDVVHPETGESLEVEASLFPARHGLRDRFGAPLEPDDEVELEICRVWNSRGQTVDCREFEPELLAEVRRTRPR